MPKSTFFDLCLKAISRGWKKGNPILLKHVENSPRTGAPLKIVGELEKLILYTLIKNKVT